MIIKSWITTQDYSAAILEIIIKGSCTHYCGYVGVPSNNIFYGKENYSDTNLLENLDTHKGITYADNNKDYPIKNDGELWWLGFDCDHHGDKKEICNIDYCFNICNKMSKQIKEIDELHKTLTPLNDTIENFKNEIINEVLTLLIKIE